MFCFSMQLDRQEFSEVLAQEKRIHILDFREPEEFVKAHVKGSINVPTTTLKIASEKLYEPLKKEQVYVITNSLFARETLDELEKRGFENTHYIMSDMDDIMMSIPKNRRGGLDHEKVTNSS